MKTTIVVAIVLLCSACSTLPVGMNVQRSTARAAGDIATTAALEANYDQITPEKVIEVASTVKDTLNSVDLAAISRDDLVALIESRISVELLKNWATKIVGVVPEDMNLGDAKVVMVDMLDQVILAATKFDPAEIKPRS